MVRGRRELQAHQLTGTFADVVSYAAGEGGLAPVEIQGIQELIACSWLPRPDAESRAVLEAAGVVFDEVDDPVCQPVRLPPGWRMDRHDAERGVRVLDGAGLLRATAFYKAVAYDRSGWLSAAPAPAAGTAPECRAVDAFLEHSDRLLEEHRQQEAALQGRLHDPDSQGVG